MTVGVDLEILRVRVPAPAEHGAILVIVEQMERDACELVPVVLIVPVQLVPAAFIDGNPPAFQILADGEAVGDGWGEGVLALLDVVYAHLTTRISVRVSFIYTLPPSTVRYKSVDCPAVGYWRTRIIFPNKGTICLFEIPLAFKM